MTSERYLLYRGDIKAAVGVGGVLVFTTVHAENQPTAVYRLDADKLTLAEDALPRGGTALLVDGDTLWVAGSDGRVYRAAGGGAPAAFGPQLATAPSALALLAEDRLAVLVDKEIAILGRKHGKLLQTLQLPDPGSALAADPTGQWLVAGTVKGTIAVFDCEDKPGLLLGEAQRLHEGAVSALLFESEELRFLSAGADQKLLLTHARGKLEPEDKGRGAGHSDLVTALLWGPGDRFYSGSRDSTIKTWPRSGATRPATLKDGVGSVVALAIVAIHNRPHLVAACDDNTLRFFLVDAAGKFGEAAHKLHDAYAWARHEFAQDESRGREAALRALAGFNDTAAIELLAAQLGADSDHSLRLLATQLLGNSGHPRAVKFLEALVAHSDDAVRVAALEALRRQRGADNLEPLKLALQAAKADVGRIAVEALQSLAQRDEQALALLVQTLNVKTPEVRQAALAALEKVYGAGSAESNLVALDAKHADIRRLALLRLLQRRLLQAPHVAAALRRRAEDSDAEVRRAAFLVSLFGREKLVVALRVRDAELQRQLVELESPDKTAAPAEEKKAKRSKSPERELALSADDYDPLLQATASRALDTCLRGARGLAVLGDARALGLLLQLSREQQPQARAEVCRALAALDDPRSIHRLRSLLHDPEAAVRDAAFTALANMHQADPLLVAEAGLGASYEDVRRRGLQLLVGQMRKARSGGDNRAQALLIYALNDSFEGVRSEAFKSALNLQIHGGGPQTLRFVLRSVHADIRREVLTEVMAQVNEPWAWQLLLEFFNDHDPALRAETFQFASDKTRELEPLAAALRSQYADIRKQAVVALVKRHSAPAQELLVTALVDTDKEVRQLALNALVGADARAALLQALGSPHADIRVRAARSLARHGEAAALAPLLALAGAAEPPERERQADWLALVEAALNGLAELGDGTALPYVTPLLDSKHAALRQAAATALVWVALPHHFEALRGALHHADPRVKYQAALGLAYAEDPSGASLVFSDAAREHLSADQRIVAAACLGAAGEDQLIVFLDDERRALREQALFLLMLREMKAHQGTPARCLACLASQQPRVRLTAARALENFADPAAFAQFVVELLNDCGDRQPWQITPDTVDTLAELLVHGTPQVRARTAHLVRYLVKEDPEARDAASGGRAAAGKEEEAWNHLWSVHASRLAAEIKELRRQPRAAPQLQVGKAELLRLAFGAYVGLVREQGGADGTRPAVIRVRQTALSRIQALAAADAEYARAAQPVLIQALGDPNQAVRLQAFEQLQGVGLSSAVLAAEALDCGHIDLGVRALELLTAAASAQEGQKVLEQAMLTRQDELAAAAAEMLKKQQGQVAVARRALTAVHEKTREGAVITLAGEYDDPIARDSLRQALESRYQNVREKAAFYLSFKKDRAVFEPLVKMLADAQDAEQQYQLVIDFIMLGDPRGADALLDRVANDPGGTAAPGKLIIGAGVFRRPENVDRLLAMMAKNADWLADAYASLLAISGYNQEIEDPEDERPERRWQEKQHPRHDDVLARLLEQCVALGQTERIESLLPCSRWAPGKEVDPVLATLAGHSEESIRRQAVAAVGWRLRKRHGPADALLKALQHRDSVTQFLAAEGLARAGRSEGLNVLLSALDFLSDYELRRRAVRALGELADERALDTLLKLAGEDGHALQAEAAEAIGHLGRSSKAEAIFRLLDGFAKGSGSVAENAMKGLRWLNTAAGWQLVRRRAVDAAFSFRATAMEALGYNDDPATRDLLLRHLAIDQDFSVVHAVLVSAQRLWGLESLEPDYALLQNKLAGSLAHLCDVNKLLQRICAHGEARRLFEILPACPDDVQEALALALLNRPSLPLAEARAALSSNDERSVALAAELLGRAGPGSADAAPALQKTLHQWQTIWEERRLNMARRGQTDERLVRKVTPAVESLLWATGRLGLAPEVLLAVVAARVDDPYYRSIRRTAMLALACGEVTPQIATGLEAAVLGDDAEIRALAASLIRKSSAKRATALAERALADRVSFDHLIGGAGRESLPPLHAALDQVHYQGVALPHLIAQKDLEGLRAAAANRALPRDTRLGAVEALAVLASVPAEETLAQIGRSDAEEEELRMAAWRALRRSKRTRQKAKVKA